MSEEEQSQAQPSDKELNFRALESKYESKFRQQAEETARYQKELDEMRHLMTHFQSSREEEEDDDDDVDPYLDKKRFRKELGKELGKTRETLKREQQAEIQSAINQALAKERQDNWLKQHSDFYDVMKHADALAEQDPELAETILEMPDGFERQKLVYRNIKSLKLHEPKQKEPSVQDKIEANRRSPYYQPTGMSNAPYMQEADFSREGRKKAYEKMQQLKQRLSLG